MPLFLPLLLALFGIPAGALAADAGRIKTVTGTVHVERAGSRVPAAVGAAVQAADVVVTGAASSVGITFDDDTRLSAGPHSRLAIERYRYDPASQAGALDAQLGRGTLAVVSGRLAKQSPGAVTVRTPTLVLGVRGTEFLVAAE